MTERDAFVWNFSLSQYCSAMACGDAERERRLGNWLAYTGVELGMRALCGVTMKWVKA